MSSIIVSQSNSKDTFTTSTTNSLVLTDNDLVIHGNSYANTPSPSSTTSSSINERLIQRSSKISSKIYMLSKLRYRHDKLVQSTDSLTRQYIIATTNIVFQMQRQIDKLRRRTIGLERKLARQAQLAHPIIRIPRLTKDEISTICITDTVTSFDKQIQVEIDSPAEEQQSNDDMIECCEIASSSTVKSPSITIFPKGKYCVECQHEFSHRSGFLRHFRRAHHKDPLKTNANNLVKAGKVKLENDFKIKRLSVNSLSTETKISSMNDQSESDNRPENDTHQMLVNQWDIGEGRLRPRRVSKTYNEPLAKVKCTLCSKFFREDYIKKHMRRVHPTTKSLTDINDLVSPTIESPNDMQTTDDHISSVLTTTETDIDPDTSEFHDETIKPIFLVTTCLDNYQLTIVKDFLQKFSSHTCQTSIVDSQTTHIIVNDAKTHLRPPVSLKLIEGIAHHCCCVSYRWLLDCLKYDRIIPEDMYEIEGDDASAQSHGGPQRSRLCEKKHSLFDGLCFVIKCTVKDDIHLSNDRLEQLITVCGGLIITCVTKTHIEKYEVIVLCDRFFVSERRHNYDQCRSLQINFLSSQWVLDSILEYRRKSMELYVEKPS